MFFGAFFSSLQCAEQLGESNKLGRLKLVEDHVPAETLLIPSTPGELSTQVPPSTLIVILKESCNSPLH